MLGVVTDDGTTETGSLLDDIVREGARRMLAAALEAEVNQYIAELAAEQDDQGRRLVVRNGHHRPRAVTTAAGPVEVRAPRVDDKRVDDKTGERKRFSSKILPPWCRKSPKVSEVLPLLYLHGLSAGGSVPALEQFLGTSAGLSPATVNRLTKQWQDDHAAFQQRDLSESDYVYVWADGVHPKVRLDEGLRESAESWADLLHDCRRRGMRGRELVVGDGAMGLWSRSGPKSPRGAGSPAAALAMVFKLAESAQARWRAITAPHLVALVRAGAHFENGHLAERPEVPAA
ncbi:transposase [Streptomyces orinoci]|uniref:Mutator family transposase n=1 Tax=Streptomyces orinoci TaxID=67339 RepID=A0ABV3JZ77_STRON|nr:transposase [Streptomyces orinoci]